MDFLMNVYMGNINQFLVLVNGVMIVVKTVFKILPPVLSALIWVLPSIIHVETLILKIQLQHKITFLKITLKIIPRLILKLTKIPLLQPIIILKILLIKFKMLLIKIILNLLSLKALLKIQIFLLLLPNNREHSNRYRMSLILIL